MFLQELNLPPAVCGAKFNIIAAIFSAVIAYATKYLFIRGWIEGHVQADRGRRQIRTHFTKKNYVCQFHPHVVQLVLLFHKRRCCSLLSYFRYNDIHRVNFVDIKFSLFEAFSSNHDMYSFIPQIFPFLHSRLYLHSHLVKTKIKYKLDIKYKYLQNEKKNIYGIHQMRAALACKFSRILYFCGIFSVLYFLQTMHISKQKFWFSFNSEIS